MPGPSPLKFSILLVYLSDSLPLLLCLSDLPPSHFSIHNCIPSHSSTAWVLTSSPVPTHPIYPVGSTNTNLPTNPLSGFPCSLTPSCLSNIIFFSKLLLKYIKTHHKFNNRKTFTTPVWPSKHHTLNTTPFCYSSFLCLLPSYLFLFLTYFLYSLHPSCFSAFLSSFHSLFFSSKETFLFKKISKTKYSTKKKVSSIKLINQKTSQIKKTIVKRLQNLWILEPLSKGSVTKSLFLHDSHPSYVIHTQCHMSEKSVIVLLSILMNNKNVQQYDTQKKLSFVFFVDVEMAS